MSSATPLPFRSTHRRVDDARKCKIFSTIVMPIYSASVPDHPFGVLEACSMNKDIPFEPVLTAVKMALEQHGLHTADFHTMPMHTTLRMLPPVEISLSGEESSHSQSSDHHQQHSSGQSVRPPITEATKTGAPEPMAYEDRRRSEAAECRESGEFTATKPLGHGAAPAVAPLMPAPSFVTGPPTFSIAATAGDASGLQFAQQAAVQQQHAQMQTLLVQAANFSHAMQANGGAMNGLGAAPPLPSGPQQQQALLALLQAQQLQQLQALQHHQQAAAQVVAARAAAPLIPSSNPLPIGPGPPARASAAAPIPPKLHPSTGGGLRVGSGKQGSPLGTSLDDAPEDLVYPKKAQAQGRKLTMEDLQQHFNVGLKEAASRLGICPTTLKRACRRFGIQRWPRRAIAKMQRQMSNANLRSEPGGSANSGGALAASLGNGLAGGGGGGAERRGARGAGLNGFGEDDRRASGEMAAPVGQGVMAHGFEVGDGFHGFMDIDEEALEGRKSAPPLDVLSVPGKCSGRVVRCALRGSERRNARSK